MATYTRPPAVGKVKNYTVLDLAGSDEVIRDRWLMCMLEFRLWCFNSTDERFEFGGLFRRSAKIPASGHFFFYLQLEDKWLCLVIDGPTLYLVGFITSSLGADEDLCVWEMNRLDDRTHYIEKSKKMSWQGNYTNGEEVQVGAQSILRAFYGMRRFASGTVPRPHDHTVAQWCDTFVIHFPEAGRFDSLLLCSIYCRFVFSGRVGKIRIAEARRWSKDCLRVLKGVTKKIPAEEKDDKWKSKKRSKSEGKIAMTLPAKAGRKTNSNKRLNVEAGELLSASARGAESDDESGDVHDKCDGASVEAQDDLDGVFDGALSKLKDIRLFYRDSPVLRVLYLSSMPIQLYQGKAVGHLPEDSYPPPKDSDDSLNFLVLPFGNHPHTECGYFDGQWICKGPVSAKKNSVSMMDQNESLSAVLDRQLKLSKTQLETGSTKNRAVTMMDQVSPSIEFDSQMHSICKTQSEKVTLLPDERQKDVVKGGVTKGHCTGLENLGNTCYANSVMQCLFAVPELASGLLSYAGGPKCTTVDQTSHDLTLAAGDLFLQLGQSTTPVAPYHFIKMLREGHKEFSNQDDNGYKQQDADECWAYLIHTFAQTLESNSSVSIAFSVKELFGIGIMDWIHCAESDEGDWDIESVYSLECVITPNVNNLNDGLQLLLNSESEEDSKILSRRAVFTKERRIFELPRYLAVHFGRTYWDKHLKQNVKTLQQVDYTGTLDVLEYCSDELKNELEENRKNIGKTPKHGLNTDTASSSTAKQQLTGIYDLICVLSHEGVEGSGHYVAWTKQDDGRWFLLDDARTSLCEEAEVLKLSGGGAGHTACICMYRGRTLEN